MAGEEKLGRAARRLLVPPPGLDALAWAARCARYEQARSYAHWNLRSLYLTLTFTKRMSTGVADKVFTMFLRQTASDVVKGHFRFARVMDAQSDGRPHIHLVMEAIAMEHPGVWPFQEMVRVEAVLAAWARLPAWTCTSRDQNHGQYFVEDRQLPGGERFEDCFGYMFLQHGGDQLGIACPRAACCRRPRGCIHGRMEVGR